MNKVEEKSCIQNIISQYKDTFIQDWIKNLDWSSAKETASYSEGKSKIADFSEFVFVTFGRSILAGVYVTEPMDRLMDELKEFVELCADELLPTTNNKLHSQLQTHFINLNHNLVDFSNYYRLMINELNEKLQVADNVLIINAFANKSDDYSSKLFEALEILLEVCFAEFSISYKERNIRDLILKRDKLNAIRLSQSKDEIKNILEIVCEKIDYLLIKYSSISSNKNLKYSLNFTQQTIKLLDDKESRFTSYKRYCFFLYPHDTPQKVIREWQNDCYDGNAKMWEMALLMRYYTKVERHENQIDNLIKQFDDFAKKQKTKDTTLFDSYALNTISNYMYNCRFSFLTSTAKFSFERLVDEMRKIENIQSSTGIKDYHPYQKTVEFLKGFIRKEISSKKDINLITEHKSLYNKTLKELQETYQWCKKTQFYPFQLCYDECLDKITDLKMEVFTPSSFCRPIDYVKLDEIIERFRTDSMTLDSEILLYKEELEILELKNSIEKNKKSYIEILGIFTGLITFLIGCVTIFTNVENPKVSLFEKIEHVSLLGIIVLLLINGGYFLTSEVKCKSIKFWFFLITSILYIFVLVKTYILQS